MSSTRSQHYNPWPKPTPVSPQQYPIPPASSIGRAAKRRRRDPHTESILVPRQVITDQSLVAAAKTRCQFLSGNDIISCYPTANTVIAQHQWATFVWNSRRPELTQINKVDIYLFRGDSREQVLHARNIQNPFGTAGVYTAQVNDSWFGAAGEQWGGQNVSYPYYWVITRSDSTLDGSQVSQPIFSAIQTTVADSVSSASVAAASSASVISSLSSLSAASLTLTSSPSSTPGSGAVQSDAADSSFPHWAIAVITVLGFLAIASLGILAFLIIRRMRRNREELGSGRNSMGSSTPMMANAGGQQGSPLLATSSLPPQPHSPVGTASAIAAPGILAGGAAMSERGRDAPSLVLHDGASTTSAGDTGPFSGADAAIMADAFRKMLRKPDFAGRLEEAEDNHDGANDDEDGDQSPNPRGAGLIGRELAEEGKDIRSVISERGVRVETGTIGSDGGSTALDQGQRRDTH